MEMQHGTPQGELARFDSAIDNIFLPAALGPGTTSVVATTVAM